jgi:hypothetical protein
MMPRLENIALRAREKGKGESLVSQCFSFYECPNLNA